MVVTKNLKEDFFDKLCGKHNLVFAASGVDSACAFKILKSNFRNYNIMFSYSIINSKTELKENYNKYGKIDNVILINCGSIFDVIDFFEIEDSDDRVVYILDSQRPLHINNYYNSTQVKVLSFREDFEYVPDFEMVFSNEDDEEDDSEEDSDTENSERSAKRRRFDPENLERRIQMKKWRQQRENVLLEYEKRSFHGTSSSIVAYHLSVLINQGSSDLLWAAIVGHTSQFLLNFIDLSSYNAFIDLLASYLQKVKGVTHDSNERQRFSCISIDQSEELSLWLYRHWSLREALYYTPVTLTAFRLCRVDATRIKEFLAFLGIPQTEYVKSFSSMKLEIKDKVKSLFRDNCEKFNIPREELFLSSFVASWGYYTPLSAVDAAFVVIAILDNTKDKEEVDDKFLKTANFLSLSNIDQINSGLGLAKEYIETMNVYTKGIIESGDVITYGPFIHVTIKRNSNPLLHAPLMQYILSRYILEAKFSVNPRLGKRRKTELLPFVLCSEVLDKPDTLSFYGIPPLSNRKGQNSFGQIFETILQMIKSKSVQNNFDICKIEINYAEKIKIYQKITQLLNE